MVNCVFVRCPGCQDIIMLRLSVGYANRQPFYYVCNKCKCATRGALIVDFEKVELKLDLEAGEILDSDVDADQIYTFDPNLPTRSDAKSMMDPGGSPFLFTYSILGESIVEYQTRCKTYLDVIKQDWLNLKRLTNFYLNSNWERFDALYKEIMNENLNEHPIWVRVDILYRLYDLIAIQMMPHPYYVEMKSEWNSFLLPKGINKKAISNYQDTIIIDSEYIELRISLFNCLEQYIECGEILLSGLAVEMYPMPLENYGDLRIYRDEFPVLRDLYVQAFEACHHALTFIVELINVVKRGNPISYCGQPEIKKLPNNRKQFNRQTSQQKAFYLRELPVWNSAWHHTLDRTLRNKIGHRLIHHDLISGNLVRSGEPPIPYIVLVAKTQRLIYPLVSCLNALKIVEIHNIMRSMKST